MVRTNEQANRNEKKVKSDREMISNAISSEEERWSREKPGLSSNRDLQKIFEQFCSFSRDDSYDRFGDVSRWTCIDIGSLNDTHIYVFNQLCLVQFLDEEEHPVLSDQGSRWADENEPMLENYHR